MIALPNLLDEANGFISELLALPLEHGSGGVQGASTRPVFQRKISFILMLVQVDHLLMLKHLGQQKAINPF